MGTHSPWAMLFLFYRRFVMFFKTFFAILMTVMFAAAPAFACDPVTNPCPSGNCTASNSSGGYMWVDTSGSAGAWGTGDKVDMAAFSSGQYNMSGCMSGNCGDDAVNIAGGFMAGTSQYYSGAVEVGGYVNGYAGWGKYQEWSHPTW